MGLESRSTAAPGPFFWKVLTLVWLVWVLAVGVAGSAETRSLPYLFGGLPVALGAAFFLSHPWARLVAWTGSVRRSEATAPRGGEAGQVAGRLLEADGKLSTLRQELARAREELDVSGRVRAQEIKEQTSLFEVSRAVTSTLHVDRVLQEVVTHSLSLMGGDASALWLRRLDTLEMKAVSGLDAVAAGQVLPMNAFSSGLTQFGQPHVVRHDDPSDDVFPAVHETLQRYGFHVMLAMPLASRGNTVGVLGIYYRHATDAELEHRNTLLATVGSQAAIAIENARLYEEQQHVTELLQRSLQPRAELGVDGVQVGHRFLPSKELSGDYYDIIHRAGRRFDLVIADVAGKGPDAAIHTARTKSIIEAHATGGLSPSQVLDLLNQQMAGPAEDMHLVTVFYAQVDLDRGQLVYSSAGHEPPLLWGPGQAEPAPLESHQVLIGVSLDVVYQNVTVPVGDGTWIVLYTDGVTEARSLEGEFFGLAGLLRVIQTGDFDTPQDLVNAIYTAVRHFSDGRITDDLSLLAVRIGLPS